MNVSHLPPMLLSLAFASVPYVASAEVEAYLYECGARISWEASEDHDRFHVEFWSREDHSWQQTGPEVHRNPGHLTQGATAGRMPIIRPGRLHRVAGCTSDLSSCETSKVMWAPWRGCPDEFGSQRALNQMEPTVSFTRDGSPYRIGGYTAKDIEPARRMNEYNTALALRELASFEEALVEAPPMVKPLWDRNLPYLRQLFFSVYWYYQIRQQGGGPIDLEGTGNEGLASSR